MARTVDVDDQPPQAAPTAEVPAATPTVCAHCPQLLSSADAYPVPGCGADDLYCATGWWDHLANCPACAANVAATLTGDE